MSELSNKLLSICEKRNIRLYHRNNIKNLLFDIQAFNRHDGFPMERCVAMEPMFGARASAHRRAEPELCACYCHVMCECIKLRSAQNECVCAVCGRGVSDGRCTTYTILTVFNPLNHFKFMFAILSPVLSGVGVE